jgi:uncharacterized protein YndB with AHSA1/START domain
MNNTVVSRVSNTAIVRIERIFDAPCEAVFSIFIKKEKLGEWWSPSGKAHIEIDAQPGGAWKFTEGNGVSFFGFFHEVTAPERIVRTGEFALSPERGHVVLEHYEFTKLDGGRTKLELTEAFLNIEDCDAMLQSGMEAGLAESYKKIDKILQNQKMTD